MKEKKWRIELTEHQLMILAKCVEDCHRFVGGQMELSNSPTFTTRFSFNKWNNTNENLHLTTYHWL